MLPPVFTRDLLRQLELLKLRSRRAFLGTRQGGHISLKRGHGIEFSDYRKYELGDDPRHIDWNVYARSERLYVKRFQEEQDLPVFIFLDATPSMFNPSDEHKWECARDIALALGYIALMQQDTVTVLIPGGAYSPKFSGGRGIHLMAGFLEAQSEIDLERFQRGILQALSRVRFPGVAFYISDFLEPLPELRRQFDLLRSRNLDLTAIQVLGERDLQPLPGEEAVVAVDSETGREVELTLSAEERSEYDWLLKDHNQRLRDYLASCSISCALAVAKQNLSEFMAQELAATGLLQ